MGQVLAWAMGRDLAIAGRLATALGWWWLLRGRLAGQYGRCCARWPGAPGREARSGAPRRFWLGYGWRWTAPDLPESLDAATAMRDASGTGGRPGHWLDGLAGRSVVLVSLAGSPRRPARPAAPWPWPAEIGDPAAQVVAHEYARPSPPRCATTRTMRSSWPGRRRRSRGVPGSFARMSGYILTGALITAGDLAAAEQACAAALARSREAGDVLNQWAPAAADGDLGPAGGPRPGRRGAPARRPPGHRADRRLVRAGLNCLEDCGYLCAATGRPAEAITMWAASDTALGNDGAPAGMRRRDEPSRAGPPGARAWPDPVPQRHAARR